jgi:hypothetical protein
MGGFVLDDQTLSLEDIENLVEKDEIEYPIISKDEIKDKSKGDGITKGLVLIQTTWFLLQCIARRVQHLSITEIELVTAAFALLNVATYALWWDKPLNVQRPVRVQRMKHACDQGDGVAKGNKEARRGDSQERAEAAAGAAREHTTFSTRIRIWGIRFWRFWSNAWEALVTAFKMVLGPFWSMMAEDENDDTLMFFAGKNEDRNQRSKIQMGAVIISIVFGGIHCIAWSFPFPSHAEQLLWRISSIPITGVPLLLLVLFFIPDKFSPRYIVVNIFPILYLLARVTLLVLAFMALRSLPPSALQTVHWTTFLPHI